MAEHSNIERLRTAYQEWNDSKGASVDTWLALCAENIQFISSAMGRQGMSFTKPCNCMNDVRAYFEGLAKDWEMDHFSFNNFIGEGDMIVAHGSCGWTHRRSGRKFDILKADVWTFRDGKAIRIIEHYDSAPILEAVAEYDQA